MDDSVAIALRWLKEMLDSENIEYQIVAVSRLIYMVAVEKLLILTYIFETQI